MADDNLHKTRKNESNRTFYYGAFSEMIHRVSTTNVWWQLFCLLPIRLDKMHTVEPPYNENLREFGFKQRRRWALQVLLGYCRYVAIFLFPQSLPEALYHSVQPFFLFASRPMFPDAPQLPTDNSSEYSMVNNTDKFPRLQQPPSIQGEN